jgi:membrane-associated PAP2 superfamily phosphatase
VKWIAIVAGGLMLVVAGIAAIGSLLPRNHKASRTLRLTLPPADVWPVLIQATEASDVPVDVLERDPPRRLVTRVTEKEKNFGGTWTITIAPTPSGSDVTITEDGWVANPIFRFASRFIIGHHATMDALLKQVAKTLNEPAALSGE